MMAPATVVEATIHQVWGDPQPIVLPEGFREAFELFILEWNLPVPPGNVLTLRAKA